MTLSLRNKTIAATRNTSQILRSSSAETVSLDEKTFDCQLKEIIKIIWADTLAQLQKIILRESDSHYRILFRLSSVVTADKNSLDSSYQEASKSRRFPLRLVIVIHELKGNILFESRFCSAI